MKRASYARQFSLGATCCLIVFLGVGCASVMPTGMSGGVTAPGVSADSRPPSRRATNESLLDSGRRTFEIPSGFVRVACPGATVSRRSAVEFAYVPREISCAEAWETAVTVGREFGIDPALLFAIMRVESAFRVNVISYAGAVGLMQVMTSPAAKLGCGDLLDPLENARCGATILSRFLRRFDNRIILGLSAYNAGFGMPSKARKTSRIPANFSYPENVLRVRSKFLRWGCSPWD